MVHLRQPSGALSGEQLDPAAANGGPAAFAGATGLVQRDALSVLVEPRLLGEDDIPWLIYLCKKRYSQRYDQFGTEGWFRNTVLKQPGLFLPIRTQNAFSIALISFIPWTPSEIECNMAFICADDGAMWEAMKLMRATIDWARMRKCKRWRISSDTEYDFSPIARRLGATELSPRFSMEL
jgi:hypothetical protein